VRRPQQSGKKPAIATPEPAEEYSYIPATPSPEAAASPTSANGAAAVGSTPWAPWGSESGTPGGSRPGSAFPGSAFPSTRRNGPAGPSPPVGPAGSAGLAGPAERGGATETGGWQGPTTPAPAQAGSAYSGPAHAGPGRGGGILGGGIRGGSGRG